MNRFLLACALCCLVAPPARSQVSRPAGAPIQTAAPVAAPYTNLNLLPAPQVFPPVLDGSGSVTIALPPSFPLNTSRLRVGVFEAGRPARLADVQRDFAVINGRLQAALSISASPGNYEVRLVSGNKARTPISQAASLLVPGIRREPGWWLFNGSPFSTFGDDKPPVAPTAPFFIAGLRRDIKGKKTSQNIFVPASAPLSFKTLALPSLKAMLATGYDFAALRIEMQRQIAEARAGGERGFLGFSLPVAANLSFDVPGFSVSRVAPVLANLRTMLNGVAPDAALVVEVVAFAYDSETSQVIDAAARQADAISILTYGDMNPDAAMIFLKNARRDAEELPNYDLPIFVRSQQFIYGRPYLRDASFSLDLFMGGATGIISDTPPTWLPLIHRNAPLFVGSVTLEDIGILPSTAIAASGEPGDESRNRDEALYTKLRGAGRIPLLARAKAGKETESFAISLGTRISNATIDALRAAATDGARVYIEGAPMQDETGKTTAWRLASLVGGTIAPVEKSTPELRRTFMTLEDGWTFGTARGTRVEVEQAGSVTLNKGTVASQAQQEKGKYTLTEPRVAATLADGTPALIINPVGKGEVIWMPHRVITENAVKKDVKAGAARLYYAAVAAYVQSALVQVRGTDARFAGASSVRVALRRSARGTFLLALFNDADRPAAVEASVTGAAGVALDLATETELPLTVRGFFSDASVTIEPRGWKLIAFAGSRRALDDERNAPQGQVKLR